MNEYIVYMPYIATELRKEGFNIIRTEVNPHKPQFECYVFENTPEFIKAFTRITSQSKSRK